MPEKKICRTPFLPWTDARTPQVLLAWWVVFSSMLLDSLVAWLVVGSFDFDTAVNLAVQL